MARSLLPTDVELASLRTIDDVLTWVGLDEAPWLAMSNCLGGVDSMRVFASLPAATPQPAFERARIPATATTAERVLTAVEIIQIGLVWRITRQAYALPDVDPLLPEPSAHATGSTAARAAAPASTRSGSSPTKRVKMSTAVDQLDESEVDLLDGNEVEQAYRNFREAVGADPLVDADPTVEQITAMYTKVLKRFEAPYADFSVLTPFGRRTQKQAKARNFILQQDGTWKTVEIPGPPTFMAWSACWKIYRTVLLMLKHPANATTRTPATPIVTVAALEEYYNRIVELNNEFPEAWHLILQAEDQCRGEQFERFQRELVRAKNEGRLPMNLDFDQNRPWVGVFQFAARCQEYWDRVVIRPAQTFLARGGASKNMSKKDAEDTQYSEATSQALHRPPGEGQSKAARRRQRDKAKIQSLQKDPGAEKFSEAPWRKTAGAGPQASQPDNTHPRRAGREFQTDREGRQVCFAFAKGAVGACSEPCPQGRSHCCQYCLGPHPNSQCPKASEKGAGRGRGKGKGK